MGHSDSIRGSVKGFTMGYSMKLELDVKESYLSYLTNSIRAHYNASSILSNLQLSIHSILITSL